eukprot:753239-Pyramimonas_sp.AAC.1
MVSKRARRSPEGPERRYAGATQLVGLVYSDGVDAAGRPVIVIDAEHVPRGTAARQEAVDFMKAALLVGKPARTE